MPIDAAAKAADLALADGRCSLKDVSRHAAREAERVLILRMLQQTRWNRKEAAEILGISYKALLYKIKENGLDKAPCTHDATSSSTTTRSRCSTPGAFDFVLDTELKRAVRAQNFLTLVVRRDAPRVGGPDASPPTTATLTELARRRRARGARHRPARPHRHAARCRWCCSTPTSSTRAASSIALVEPHRQLRVPDAAHIAVGAACYPTHAVDAESLKRQAVTRPIVNWRARPRPPGTELKHAH